MIRSFDGYYSFLSNFYSVPVFYNGMLYDNSEAAYQCAKTHDDEYKRLFVNCNPGRAKRLGKRVPIRDDWDNVKVPVMKDIVHCKFSQNSDISELLLSTGDEELIEGNTWHDNFWGACSCENCRSMEKKNMLGKILMEERDRIKIGDMI